MEEMKTALLELTSQICKADGFRFKHAIILKNTVDETAEAIGVITTRALYKNGRNSLDRDEDAFSGYDSGFPVSGLIYKYIDGEWAKQTGKLFPYATYSTKTECNTFQGLNYLANYKIVWNNYPILYAGTLRGVADASEKNNYKKSAKPKYYKLSDEPFSLDMAPIGTLITIGRYKVGESEIVPLTWGVAGYTECFKAVVDDDGNHLYGENKVVLATDKVFDILPINNKADYRNELAFGETSEIMKYLNSSAPNNWWYEAFEGDTPDDRGYFPEGGFLRYFTQQELEALQEVRTRRNATAEPIRGKVHLPSVYEIASTTGSKYSDAWDSNTFGITYLQTPCYHPVMAYHPISPQSNFTLTIISFWKRDMTSTNGNQLSGSSSSTTTSGDKAIAVVPCIYIHGDQRIKTEPNEDGYFELIYPQIEAFDVDYILDSKRNITNSINTVLDTKRSSVGVGEEVLPAYRNRVFESDTTLDAHRHIVYHGAVEYRMKTSRHRIANCNRVVQSKRSVIGVGEEIMPLHRDIAVNLHSVDSVLSTAHNQTVDNLYRLKINRNIYIFKSFDLSLSSKRQAIVDISIDLKAHRNIMIFEDIEYLLPLSKKIIANENSSLNFELLVISDSENNIGCNRNIVSSLDNILKTARQIECIQDFTTNLACKRNVIQNNTTYLKSNRKIITSLNTLLPLHIKVLNITKYEVNVPLKRSVIVNFTGASATIRHIIAGEDNLLPLSRVVRAIDRRGAIELLQTNTVKNDKGISNIEYERIGDIIGNFYPIKANVESLPIGLSDKAKYLLITKNKKITSSHYVRIDGVIYGIDMLTKYSMHKEVYLKEL